MSMLQLPYVFKSNDGFLCPPSFFCKKSNINPAWSDKEIIEHVAVIFEDYGYEITDMRVERKGDDIILRWIWCFRYSPDLHCSCLLDEKE